jgi:hypothetical protein
LCKISIKTVPPKTSSSEKFLLRACYKSLGDILIYNVSNFWHRSFTFNSNKSPNECNNFSVYYPDVCLQLNMFRAFFRHYQELNDCSGSFWFYLRIMVIVVLCSWSGRSVGRSVGRPDYEHSTTITMIRRYNQTLPLQSFSSWWWAGKRPKHVEL